MPTTNARTCITVDSNSAERHIFSCLADELREDAGVHVQVRRLDVGDVEITVPGQRLLIERKTAADMAASICDGRYREQKRRIQAGVDHADADPARAIYIVETARPLDMRRDVRVGGMPMANVAAALVKTAVRDSMPVLYTSGVTDTVWLLAYMARELQRGGFEPPARGDYTYCVKKRRRENTEDPAVLYRLMLMQVPGMSAAKAGAIATRYPRFVDLHGAVAAELAAIDVGARKLGPKLASRLLQVLTA